jgi:hypothetical protein
MISTEEFLKHPATEELIKRFEQIVLNTQRPADQIVLDESDFCAFLKISKRHAANLRAKRLVKYSKTAGKIYYILSDVLDFIKENQVTAISQQSKFSSTHYNL